jgi:hypothetical protein
MYKRTVLLASLLATAAVGGACSASASAAVPQPASFDGACSVQDDASFDPPVSNTEQDLGVTYDGSGTCSGSLNGRTVSSEPVLMHHTATSHGSCLGASTAQPGQGSLTFADGTRIGYSVSFDFIGTEGSFSFQGERGGDATGRGTFLTPRTPPDAALQCGNGGASKLPLDISLQTTTPLVGAAPTAKRHRRHRHKHRHRHGHSHGHG